MLAVLRGELHDARPARRRIHHALDGGHAGVVQGARHCLIGGDHEVLDEAGGAIGAARGDALHLPVAHRAL